MPQRYLALIVTGAVLFGLSIVGWVLWLPLPSAESMTSLDPPGASHSADLEARLEAALTARTEPPRTRHLRSDGRPKFANRLLLESSPYLLQHAHNPVNWYPWGDEAFARAKALGRPVLLSVGYSTCHWCHVMEEESFEDPEIARFINEHYVAIKVDREERPDVDAVYMTAVYLVRRSGGWPMTVWLTPDRKPFFAGTYFPPRDGVRGSRVGFLTVLKKFSDAWTEGPDEVTASADRLTEAVARNFAPRPGGDVPGMELLDRAHAQVAGGFDAVNGGRQGAPKFPSSFPTRLMLRHHRRTGDAAALDKVRLTLDKMAAGGMYDQVGGGFHRYSTDARWLVPHFEKMLYDNALLVWAYLEAWQVTGEPVYRTVVDEVLLWVEREMTSPSGAFYSAQDADSPNPDKHGEREEGWFYTWTPLEIEGVLGSRAPRFSRAYGVTPGGNFEGRNILHWPRPLTDPDRGEHIVEREELYAWRADRPPPLRDDKLLTSWNGLMIAAHARAALVLGAPHYAERAARAADFLLSHRVDGRLVRTVTGGEGRGTAFLDDYAFLIGGLLDLHEATGDVRWVREAMALDAVLARHHEDPAGGYFLTPDDHETLLAREKPDNDGAEPSGNSVQVMNLLRLHALTTDDRYRQRAERAMGAFAADLDQRPTVLTELLVALDFHLGNPKEIVLVTPSRAAAEPLLDVVRRDRWSNRVLVVVEADEVEATAAVLPVVQGKFALDGRATAYVCERGLCERPVTEPEALRALLRP